MGAASAVYAALQKPEKVLFHIKKASSSVVICLMRQVKGLVLVRLPTAWEERKLRKPQLEAAAKALQMKYATLATFLGLKISLKRLLCFVRHSLDCKKFYCKDSVNIRGV